MGNSGSASTLVTYRARLAAALTVLCVAALSTGARSQTATIDEVKAAFLFNFAKFVEWPDGDAGPLQIGVLGNDNVSDSLREIVRGKSVNGRSLASRRVTANDDLASLDLFFVGASEKSRIPDLLKRLDGTSVLTVSDVDKFCHQGGVIALTQEGNHVRFDINLDAAERSKLKVSSKLLALARTVHPVRAAAGDR
ncbi:MAG TPA: YfiR family protein [Vicinamibacterales bacterium]|jgi:hypothetical protein